MDVFKKLNDLLYEAGALNFQARDIVLPTSGKIKTAGYNEAKEIQIGGTSYFFQEDGTLIGTEDEDGSFYEAAKVLEERKPETPVDDAGNPAPEAPKPLFSGISFGVETDSEDETPVPSPNKVAPSVQSPPLSAEEIEKLTKQYKKALQKK